MDLVRRANGIAITAWLLPLSQAERSWAADLPGTVAGPGLAPVSPRVCNLWLLVGHHSLLPRWLQAMVHRIARFWNGVVALSMVIGSIR